MYLQRVPAVLFLTCMAVSGNAHIRGCVFREKERWRGGEEIGDEEEEEEEGCERGGGA